MKDKLIRASVAILGCLILVPSLIALGVTGTPLLAISVTYGFIAGWSI